MKVWCAFFILLCCNIHVLCTDVSGRQWITQNIYSPKTQNPKTTTSTDTATFPLSATIHLSRSITAGCILVRFGCSKTMGVGRAHADDRARDDALVMDANSGARDNALILDADGLTRDDAPILDANRGTGNNAFALGANCGARGDALVLCADRRASNHRRAGDDRGARNNALFWMLDRRARDDWALAMTAGLEITRVAGAY
ncbi:hypothetical protein B0H17DRAFT_331359 [Mycena rosella]|uniref:Uncharacterized protein n=1 Tax=Mycena rosella TaxID=1033263 RepID=A0AAD7G658_MYCRO|nr:hypothetical protein B0H17DRAFT_331359 [Mycena rosella]